MNIQSLGAASAQSRQVFAEKGNNAATPPQAGNVSATGGNKIALEENGPATPVESNKAVERAGATPSLEKLTQVVQNINKSLQSFSQDLEFSVDSESDRTIVKLVDRKTKEVIRQIPSEETLEIAKYIDNVRGMLIKQQA